MTAELSHIPRKCEFDIEKQIRKCYHIVWYIG